MAEVVAVLGAGGTMGLPMARNIARAGFDVRAWNRSVEKAEPLKEDGITVCDSASDAAHGATVVLTMLSDAQAVLETAREALVQAGDDTLWLQMSTIGLEGTQDCIELATEQGVEFIDAPVLGTKKPAEDGKLVVLASGTESLRDRVQPLFDAVGQKTMWLGEAGKGTRLKLVANGWVLTVTEATAEVFALAQALDLDPSLLLEAVEGGTLDLPYLKMKGRAIMQNDYSPMFRLALAAKDAGLVVRAAEDHNLDLPLFAAIRERMGEAAQEHGDNDMIATYLASAPG